MIPEIEVVKTTTIYGYLNNNETSFNYDIYVDFIPDEIILKYISRYDEAENAAPGTSDAMILIRSTLIDNEVLASIPRCAAFHESYNIPFQAKKSIRGTYSFDITSVTGTLPINVAAFDTYIACTLLFVKYKK